MGCSAGIIAIDLADRLLKLTPSKYALVLSTENITQNWYALDCSVPTAARVLLEWDFKKQGKQPRCQL